MVVTGILAAFVGLGLVGVGAGLVAVDLTGRDEAGFVTAAPEPFDTPAYALLSEPVELNFNGPDWLHATSLIGEVRVRASARGPVFVGIADAADARAYLASVEHAVITDAEGGASGRLVPGSTPATPPAAAGIWLVSAEGRGGQQIVWKARDGDWSVVVMNADGSRGVTAQISAGASIPSLGTIGAVLLTVGALISTVAMVVLIVAVRLRSQRQDR